MIESVAANSPACMFEQSMACAPPLHVRINADEHDGALLEGAARHILDAAGHRTILTSATTSCAARQSSVQPAGSGSGRDAVALPENKAEIVATGTTSARPSEG